MSRRGIGATGPRVCFPRVSGDEPPRYDTTQFAYCFPRVSGDEPAVKQLSATPTVFSPRERG